MTDPLEHAIAGAWTAWLPDFRLAFRIDRAAGLLTAEACFDRAPANTQMEAELRAAEEELAHAARVLGPGSPAQR
ncbi:hypothetical protein HMPREF3227_02554 [Corynebacterium sp. CMW7794]|uniref:hypothetical protein n=1 Tax=Corynebacterium TaxID=1716 RepID=UPI000794CE34|nr:MULTISPECIES: hypothetical protein [Corynebacterium]KXI15259.1 hypothetical protein HMPREF3227_02554 [Corynebacterium sp. CMW7794]MBF9011585.1 hypothetical protein [Corynebacterium phoceense]